jgi:outer membrane lipoprotein-sorting protein
MEAMAVLESVARAYAGLKTLSVEIVNFTESGDEGQSTRNSWRRKAWFEAPNKLREEKPGGNGSVLVNDGVDLHLFWVSTRVCSKHAAQQGFLQGLFRPEQVQVGDNSPVFLFSRIADTVLSAEILAEESASVLISVNYEARLHPARWFSSPVQYLIDSKTHLVSRIEAEISMQMEDHLDVRRHTVSFANAVIDEPIPPELFTFTPPADAVNASDPRRTSSGGANGISVTIHGGHSHEWKGETLVEQYELSAHGAEFTFERRLTFSEDRRELTVSETITGPTGEVTHDLSVPLA